MILSQTAVYALQATLHLAENGDSGPLRVDDIASKLDVPRNYLSKILHALARGGVLSSTRGPGGGFRLGQPADTLRLSDIVRHFDDLPDGTVCLLGRSRCSDADPCPAHAHWKGVAGQVKEFFEGTTLADLSRNGSLGREIGTG